MKKYSITIFIIIITISCIISCIKPEEIKYKDPPAPIDLTENDVAVFGKEGRQETDFGNPYSIDISEISGEKWITICDDQIKNIIRVKIDDLVKDTNDNFNGTIVDYTNDGVPKSITADSSGNIYTLTQMTDDNNVYKVRIAKYELDSDGKPSKKASWSYDVYPKYNMNNSVEVDEESYDTSLSHLSKIDLIGNYIMLSNHSDYYYKPDDYYIPVPETVDPKSSQWNTRKIRKIIIADPPTTEDDSLWSEGFEFYNIEDKTVGDRINPAILDVYTLYGSAQNSENTYVLYLDNYTVEVEKMVDGEKQTVKEGKGIYKIRSFNAETNDAIDYTFIGDGTNLDAINLDSANDVNKSDYQFYRNPEGTNTGYFSDAVAIALDYTGDTLYVLKYELGYVMAFQKSGTQFVFKESIVYNELINEEGNLQKQNSKDLEYYEDGTNKYLFIVDTLGSRLVRIKIG